MEDLRYPVGPYKSPPGFSANDRVAWIREIESMPVRLRAAVGGLSDAQLDSPYREGGWSIRQVVHHVGDSHLVAYTRMKFALTEENPPVKSYDEVQWAQLPDYVSTPLEVSLVLVDALHARWVALMRGLTELQWQRTFQHSSLGSVPLQEQLAHYAWHSKHHVAHITSFRGRSGL